MSTTIEVKKTTARVLEELKRKYGARSKDETVKKPVSKTERIPDSMFGSHPEMKPFTPRDEAKPHEP